MGKTYFKLLVGIFAFAMLVGGFVRILLVLRMIDHETGFYIQQNGVVILFNMLMLAVTLFFFFTNRLRRVDNDYPVYYQSRLSGLLCIFTGIAAAAFSIFDDLYPIMQQNLTASMMQLRNNAVTALGVLAALSLVWLGFNMLMGKVVRAAMLPAVIPSIWLAFLLVTRFNSYTTLTTISDHLLAVLFQVFAVLFLVGQARTLYGLTRKDGRNYTIPSGLCAAMFGFFLVIPNYIYMTLSRTSEIPVVMLGRWESIFILVFCCHALAFVVGMIRSIKEV